MYAVIAWNQAPEYNVQPGRDPNEMPLRDTNEKLSKDKMKPIKTQCPSVCCFYSNSETFEFHLQPGPKQRQTCMLYFRHSFLALLFFYFFLLIQFFKVNPKEKKKNPSLFLIWVVCPLPAGSALKPLPIFRPRSLTSHIPHPNGFALSTLVLSPEPGVGQEDLCARKISRLSFPRGESTWSLFFPFSSALYW